MIIVVVCKIFCNQLSTYSNGSKLGVNAKSSESARRTVANALEKKRILSDAMKFERLSTDIKQQFCQ